MQNKPNFRKAQMNVNIYYTKAYSNDTAVRQVENKPNSNPIQTQTNPISEEPKMNVSSIVAKDYQNICPCGAPKNKAKTNPISQKAKNEPKLSNNNGLRQSAPRGSKSNQTRANHRYSPPNHKIYVVSAVNLGNLRCCNAEPFSLEKERRHVC